MVVTGQHAYIPGFPRCIDMDLAAGNIIDSGALPRYF